MSPYYIGPDSGDEHYRRGRDAHNRADELRNTAEPADVYYRPQTDRLPAMWIVARHQDE